MSACIFMNTRGSTTNARLSYTNKSHLPAAANSWFPISVADLLQGRGASDHEALLYPEIYRADLVTWGVVCCATWEACGLLLTSFATLDSLATCVVPPVVWGGGGGGGGGAARRGMERGWGWGRGREGARTTQV